MTDAVLSSHALVDAEGRLQLNDHFDLIEGEEVVVTIKRVTAEELAAEDAAWTERFERHPEVLDRLIAQAERDIAAGQAIDFDPDVDELS